MPQYILRFHNISMKFCNTCIYNSDSIHILPSVTALVFALVNYTGFKDNTGQQNLTSFWSHKLQ